MNEVKDKMYKEYLENQLNSIITTSENEEKKDGFYFYLRKVYKDGKENYMLENGKLLSEEFYDSIDISEMNCYLGLFIVYDKDKGYNFIDQDGKLISDKWFINVSSFRCDTDIFPLHAEVEYKPGKKMIIGTNGKKIGTFAKKKIGKYQDSILQSNIIDKKKKTVTFGSKTIQLEDKYPIQIFGNGRYVLCSDYIPRRHSYREAQYDYVYDTKTKNYISLMDCCKNKSADHINTTYFSNILTIDNQILLFYDGKVIELNNYCKKHNILNADAFDRLYNDREKEFIENGGKVVFFNIKEDLRLLDEVIFSKLNEEKIQAEVKKLENEAKAKEDERQKKMTAQKIIMAKGSDEEKRRQQIQDKTQAIRDLKRAIETLNSLQHVKVDEEERVNVENLFIEVDDHKEIAEEYKLMLPYINLSMVSFDNVDIRGLDFSRTNINTTLLDPQKVYNKDLSGCDFTGLAFSPFSFDLTGVKTEGTIFTSDDVKVEKTI